MASYLWSLLHVVGYVSFAMLATTRTARLSRRLSAKARARDTAARIERIAKLELQLGIGLDYGLDWLVSRPVACKAMWRELVAEGNGACERNCWGCDKEYKPHDEYGVESGFKPGWYDQPADVRELTDRLCRSCYVGATRRDFAVTDFVTILSQ